MSIRRCGHSKDHFFIELGRSAVTGAGEIYMATEGTIIAQNMHETVLRYSSLTYLIIKKFLFNMYLINIHLLSVRCEKYKIANK